MQRRNYLKTFLLGSILPIGSAHGFPSLFNSNNSLSQVDFKSDWENWGDMKWIGPQYWGNRLQDWQLKNGKAICDITAGNRSLHLLTVQNPKGNTPLEVAVTLEPLNAALNQYSKGCIGLRIGAKGPFEDYRSAAVFGKGLDVGLNTDGSLLVGESKIATGLDGLPKKVSLQFRCTPKNDEAQAAHVTLMDPSTEKVLFRTEALEIANTDLVGNFALLADVNTAKKKDEAASVAFSNWRISSPNLFHKEDNLFGPICFAQYTVHQHKLKLTAQLAPIEELKGHQVLLEFKKDGQWVTETNTQVTHSSRAINFTVTPWDADKAIPYRIRVQLPLKDSTHQYDYEGTIAQEPLNRDKVKVAVFSCNAHFGFPDADIHQGVSQLDPDLSLFLGDQFYEHTGGFGAQYNGDFDKTCLDYLRKWMMFGWSYREIFRHKPCAIIPDDHDVYHGNVWGESGKKADTSQGFGASAQDSGGYKMAADWVNMVQFTQTSHLPDPIDPTPVKQNIGVYFTHWNYGGISFAILEDRKFKSAPKHILPPEAEVYNGWIQNSDFDIKKNRHLGGELLGARQESFLESWASDWPENAQMKVVLSQTNFATVATLPKEAKSDNVVPSLHIPEKGEYVKGDKPTADMDSNGWPADKRDIAVKTIRKGYAFHIAGDQHLGSYIQYGVDAHGDSGYAFAGPALNNIWPRRFWPDVDSSNHTVDHPAYVGEHFDGFGNRMTVKAVANPHNRHQEPKILHNRAVGYGIVSFDKKERQIETSCYQRFHNPMEAGSQYPGWPQTIHQLDNYGKEALAWLPRLEIESDILPVLEVLDEQGNLVYALRLPEKNFTPKVFAPGQYSLILKVPESGYHKRWDGIKAKKKPKGKMKITLI